MKLLLTLLFLTACTSMTASAKWAPLPLKSLVEYSNCIVVAEFVSEDSRKTEGQRTDQLVTLKVTTIIKGTPTEQIIVAGYEDPMMCKAQFIFPTTKSGKYLLFLQKRNDQYSVLNGIFGSLIITDNKVNWFTDETQMQSMGERKPAELDAAIAAIKQANAPSPSPAMTDIQAMEVLMKIESFGFGGGRGQTERASDTAFQTLISAPNANEKFITLFEKGNTYSKLYALCALHSIDPASFQKLSKSFNMDEEINTQNGCIVSNMKASEILADISKGNFDGLNKVRE